MYASYVNAYNTYMYFCMHYIYIYIYMCVCVFVCSMLPSASEDARTHECKTLHIYIHPLICIYYFCFTRKIGYADTCYSIDITVHADTNTISKVQCSICIKLEIQITIKTVKAFLFVIFIAKYFSHITLSIGAISMAPRTYNIPPSDANQTALDIEYKLLIRSTYTVYSLL